VFECKCVGASKVDLRAHLMISRVNNLISLRANGFIVNYHIMRLTTLFDARESFAFSKEKFEHRVGIEKESNQHQFNLLNSLAIF
jgi:hypothetical protein